MCTRFAPIDETLTMFPLVLVKCGTANFDKAMILKLNCWLTEPRIPFQVRIHHVVQVFD